QNFLPTILVTLMVEYGYYGIRTLLVLALFLLQNNSFTLRPRIKRMVVNSILLVYMLLIVCRKETFYGMI
ncbi:unnamed protein product, partial [Musa textilis]